MCDLQVLAYQADLTRVITFMLGREFSGVTYPQIGVPDAHHPITHHQQEPEKIAKVAKINAYHVTQFAYLLEKLRATPDGDGSLLDHAMIIYGTGMGDCNAHDPRNIPLLLAGGGAGSAQRRTSHPVSEGDAAGEPAPDAARQARRAARIGIGDSTGQARRLAALGRNLTCAAVRYHLRSTRLALASRPIAVRWHARVSRRGRRPRRRPAA